MCFIFHSYGPRENEKQGEDKCHFVAERRCTKCPKVKYETLVRHEGMGKWLAHYTYRSGGTAGEILKRSCTGCGSVETKSQRFI